MSKQQLAEFLEYAELPPFFLITYHPVTLSPNDAERALHNLLVVLDTYQSFNMLITLPNADSNSRKLKKILEIYAKNHPQRVKLFESMGQINYLSAMKYASAVIGNSSSGIIEAASFGKYVVNLGNRQEGRTCGENVIHVPFEHNSIISAALKYENATYNGANVYEMDNGSTLIIETLKNKMNGLS